MVAVKSKRLQQTHKEGFLLRFHRRLLIDLIIEDVRASKHPPPPSWGIFAAMTTINYDDPGNI